MGAKFLTAVVFAGQGAQRVGMQGESHLTGLVTGLAGVMRNGPLAALSRTSHAQPALVAHGLTASASLPLAWNYSIEAVAGHSVGEITAAAFAGALSPTRAVQTARTRGLVMQACADAQGDAPLGMFAIMPTSAQAVRPVADRVAARTGLVCEIAGLNAPKQVVISGHTEALNECIAELKASKLARKAIPLNVSAPFHCSIMRPAETALADVLHPDAVSDARIPIVRNVDGRAVHRASDIRHGLISQVTAPVDWVRCIETLIHEFHVRVIVEVSPQRTLGPLVEAIAGKDSEVRVVHRSTAE